MLKEDINKIVQISAEEFAVIELFFQRKSRRKGSVLVESGKTGSHEYFILKGLVAASHLSELGKTKLSSLPWKASGYRIFSHLIRDAPLLWISNV